MRINIDKIDPKLRDEIKNITSLDTDKIYFLEISRDLPAQTYTHVAKNIHKIFNSLGLNCIVAVEGTISNIYEMTGGDNSDSRASIE